jgi:hypothetical protein
MTHQYEIMLGNHSTLANYLSHSTLGTSTIDSPTKTNITPKLQSPTVSIEFIIRNIGDPKFQVSVLPIEVNTHLDCPDNLSNFGGCESSQGSTFAKKLASTKMDEALESFDKWKESDQIMAPLLVDTTKVLLKIIILLLCLLIILVDNLNL